MGETERQKFIWETSREENIQLQGSRTKEKKWRVQ